MGMETHILGHMEQCMPTTQMKPQTPNNEVGNQMKTNIKEVNEHINNLNNEVARLRELLHRAIETAETLSSGGSRACRELHHAKKDRHELGEVCPVEGKIENAIRNLVMMKLEARYATADAIRYLRSEIETLKKNQK